MNDALFVDDRSIDHGARLDGAVGQHDRIADHRAPTDLHARRQHAIFHGAFDDAAVGDEAVRHHRARADIDGRPLFRSGVDDPVAIEQIERRLIGQQIHVRFPVGLHGPHIHPVTIERIRVDFVRAHHFGNDVLAKVMRRFGISGVVTQHLAEHFGIEDVDTHRTEVAPGQRRLLFKTDDAAVLVGLHDAKARRFIRRHFQRPNRHIGALLLMEGDHIVVVHLVDMIAAEDDDVVRLVMAEEIEIQLNGAGRARVDFHAFARAGIRLQQPHPAVQPIQIPRRAGANVIVQRARPVLRQNAHRRDARVGAVGQHEVDDAILSGKGHGRFGAFLRENAEPAAASAGEN